MENIEFGIVNKPKVIVGYCDETGKPLYEGITYLESLMEQSYTTA